MTREEAIAMLKRIQEPEAWEPQINQAAFEALDMAIKALEQEPCGDAISRQAVKDMLDARGVKAVMTFEHFKELLDKLPSVTPQPKMGKWKDIMVGDMPAQACDRCNTFYPLAYTGGGHKYCPNCGTKMEESKEP